MKNINLIILLFTLVGCSTPVAKIEKIASNPNEKSKLSWGMHFQTRERSRISDVVIDKIKIDNDVERAEVSPGFHSISYSCQAERSYWPYGVSDKFSKVMDLMVLPNIEYFFDVAVVGKGQQSKLVELESKTYNDRIEFSLVSPQMECDIRIFSCPATLYVSAGPGMSTGRGSRIHCSVDEPGSLKNLLRKNSRVRIWE